MRSLEDDLASYDRIEILEYLNMLKTAEEFGGKIVRFELHGDTMLVTVRGTAIRKSGPTRWTNGVSMSRTTVFGSSTSSWSNLTASYR